MLGLLEGAEVKIQSHGNIKSTQRQAATLLLLLLPLLSLLPLTLGPLA